MREGDIFVTMFCQAFVLISFKLPQLSAHIVSVGKMLFTFKSQCSGIGNHLSLTIILYGICTGLLILTYSLLPSFLQVSIETDAFAQELALTSPEGLSCTDGSIPDTSTGLCADGLASQSNLSEFSSTSPPLGPSELAADNATTMNNNTAGQILGENELDSGEINASAPAQEEIQMDINGDGIVDENESQNQPVLTGNNLTTEEIQMDTNGDGIVDENESQNQPVLTGNNLTTEEIQMDTNGDGIVDENESQNQPVLTGNNLPLGPKTGAQTFGGGTPQAKGCEGDLAIELPQARKTLDIADQNAGDFLRLLQAGGGIKQFPTTNLYWFAKLYSGTTYLELRDLKNVEHPAMVAHFIPIFFGLYKDAMDNYQNRATSKVPAHWMTHFKASQESKVSMTGAQISIETGSEAHIQGDMAKAFVLAYKTFVSKYCPDNPPPLEYFHESFFGPAALKVFPESQGDIFTEIARTVGPQGVSIEKTKTLLLQGSNIFHALDLDTVYEWRQDAWDNAKKEINQ